MFNNSLDDNQLLSSIIDLGRTQGDWNNLQGETQ